MRKVRIILVVIAVAFMLPKSSWAQGKSQSKKSHQFAVIMNGPITIDEAGLHANLFDINSGFLIGKTTRGGAGCISFGTPPPTPIFSPCDPPPVLAPNQFYYEDPEVTIELPGGTLLGSLKGWEVFNSNPPVNGGDRSAAAIEEGEITGGTGLYANAEGTFLSRISDEFKVREIFGFESEAPYWFNNSVIVISLR